MKPDVYTPSGAVISQDQLYRYFLWRRWGTGRVITWLMLNPSTADANTNDATIRKCIGFAKRWGYDGIHVLNLFALRSRDPLCLLDNLLRVECSLCGHKWTRLETECVGPWPCENCGRQFNDIGEAATGEVDIWHDPFGPEYTLHLGLALTASTDPVIAAWGCESTLRKSPILKARPGVVLSKIREIAPNVPIECLGMSKTGNPYHPLMLGYDTPRIPFEWKQAA